MQRRSGWACNNSYLFRKFWNRTFAAFIEQSFIQKFFIKRFECCLQCADAKRTNLIYVELVISARRINCQPAPAKYFLSVFDWKRRQTAFPENTGNLRAFVF